MEKIVNLFRAIMVLASSRFSHYLFCQNLLASLFAITNLLSSLFAITFGSLPKKELRKKFSKHHFFVKLTPGTC
jgi:hypothetical protein